MVGTDAGDRLAAPDSDETESIEGFDEISPELMYTAEHDVMTSLESIVSDGPAEESGSGQTDAETGATNGSNHDDAASRRRRGRRGGRRGRGSDSGDR